MMNLEYVVLVVVIGVLTYSKKALDLLGSIFMIIMGVIIIFAAGINWLFLIFIFLILGILFTKYKHEYKKDIGVYEGTRTIKNVVSNGIACPAEPENHKQRRNTEPAHGHVFFNFPREDAIRPRYGEPGGY